MTDSVPVRDGFGRFLPGSPTANPHGRPVEPVKTIPRNRAELRELAQSHTPEAIEELVKIMKTARRKRDRLLAIAMLLDRGYGKAVDLHLVEELHSHPAYTSPYEIARRIAWLLTRPEIEQESSLGTNP